MKHSYKKVLALAMALAMLFSITAVAAPADSGITVMLDGQKITFGDAVPQLQSGRTFVPFRTVFEALGAQVSFDGASRTVTALRGGVTVKFVIGSSAVQVTRDGKLETIKTDAAPYIDAASDRAMIPVRFAAQSLGCIVGWDQATKTVNILDSDKLQAAYGDQFQLLDRYAKETSHLRGDATAFSGKLSMQCKVTSRGKIIPVSVTGSVNGSRDPAAMNAKANLSVDLAEALGDAPLTAEQKNALEALKSLECDYILNLNTGMVYFTCPALAKMDERFDADTWYSVSVNALIHTFLQENFDFASLLNRKSSLSVSESLLHAAEQMKDDQDAYNKIVSSMNACAAAMGDKAFTKNCGTYTANTSMAQGQSSGTLKIELTETGGKFTGSQVEVVLKGAYNACSIKASQGPAGDTFAVEFEGPRAVLRMDLNIAYAALTQAPAAIPPSAAEIADLLDLLDAPPPLAP